MPENKKMFEEPEYEIIELEVADVITTSDEGNWGGGEF